ncbi:hypothetical protein, partial [Deinococcus sp.]|uniref:hypothetical protein n=1 Tax=Deinococcus sp. TaxID=47478 RepID=UPI00286E650B
TLEAVQRHAASLPHPVQVMASMQYARMTLGLGRQLEKMRYPLNPQAATWLRVLWPELAPLCRTLLEAVKAKEYGEVKRLDREIHALNTDYEMSYQPIFPAHSPAARAAVLTEQPSLFARLGQENP